jgi:hypothetical protein
MTPTATDMDRVIESWMIQVAGDRGDLRFQDLHIDRVNHRFAEKSHWLEGAVECFAAATRIRTDRRLPFLVAVGIELRASCSRTGLNFSTVTQLERELGDSPPSLYLFEPSAKPLLNDQDCVEVGDRVHLGVQPTTRAFLREWLDSRDNQFLRSFWLLG